MKTTFDLWYFDSFFFLSIKWIKIQQYYVDGCKLWMIIDKFTFFCHMYWLTYWWTPLDFGTPRVQKTTVDLCFMISTKFWEPSLSWLQPRLASN